MKYKIILSKRFQKDIIEKLDNEFELVIAEDLKYPLDEIILQNSDCKALISFLSDNIDGSLMEKLPELRIIANYAVGYNNIDINEAKKRNIYVTNTPDILTDATADLSFSLILAVARRIVESDEYMRNGNFKGWDANLLLGKELRNATLGIIGLGKIGTQTAIRALGFGMKVIYYSRSRKFDLEKKFGFEYTEFGELVKRSDIISPHIPYSRDVHHMFNRDIFKKMKNDAIFINVARGPLVNENDLADSLESGEIYGAGLDVFEFEPSVNDRLTKMKNVVMTPHIGSATYKTRLGMAEMVYKNIKSVFKGEIPPDLIEELR